MYNWIIVNKNSLAIAAHYNTLIDETDIYMLLNNPYNNPDVYEYIKLEENQKLYNITITRIDGSIVLSYNQSNEDAYISTVIEGVRTQRDTLLQSTDWTQSNYLPHKYHQEPFLSEMRAYRQALRDLPDVVDPDDPVYPTPPDYP